MYKLRSQKGKMPITVDSLEKAIAFKNMVKFKFDRDLVIEPELDYNEGSMLIYINLYSIIYH